MGFLIAFVTVLILALIGKSLVGFSLVMPLVLAASFKLSAERSFLMAFLSGLVVSLVDGSRLGRESLGLLLASSLVHLYGRRFSRKHWGFTLVFAASGSLVYSLVVGRYILWSRIVIDTAIVGLSLPLVAWWKERFYSDSIILKI